MKKLFTGSIGTVVLHQGSAQIFTQTSKRAYIVGHASQLLLIVVERHLECITFLFQGRYTKISIKIAVSVWTYSEIDRRELS